MLGRVAAEVPCSALAVPRNACYRAWYAARDNRMPNWSPSPSAARPTSRCNTSMTQCALPTISRVCTAPKITMTSAHTATSATKPPLTCAFTPKMASSHRHTASRRPTTMCTGTRPSACPVQKMIPRMMRMRPESRTRMRSVVTAEFIKALEGWAVAWITESEPTTHRQGLASERLFPAATVRTAPLRGGSVLRGRSRHDDHPQRHVAQRRPRERVSACIANQQLTRDAAVEGDRVPAADGAHERGHFGRRETERDKIHRAVERIESRQHHHEPAVAQLA